MANTLNLLSEETFSEKMDVQNALLASIASQGGGIALSSWADVQSVVRMGLAKSIFSIGDQLVCRKGGTELVWDVIGIDHDTPTDKTKTHSLTLQLHQPYTYLAFDAPETDNPNTDRASNGSNYWRQSSIRQWLNADGAADTWWTAQHEYDIAPSYAYSAGFLSGMDEDFLAVVGEVDKLTAFNTVTDDGFQNFTRYEAEDATLNGSAMIIAESDVGDDVSGTTVGGVGNNSGTIDFTVNVKESGIYTLVIAYTTMESREIYVITNDTHNYHRTAPAGSDWNSDVQRLTIPIRLEAGENHIVLYNTTGYTPNIDYIEISNYTTSVFGEVTAERFFLLSRSEVFGGRENGVAEGEAYPYYSENSDLGSASAVADSNRIKYRNGAPVYWFLRTPDYASSCNARFVGTVGDCGQISAKSAFTIAPACCIV